MSDSKNRKPSKTVALRRAMSVIPAPLKSNLPLALIAGTALAGVETAPLIASSMGLLSPPSISAPATTASAPLPPAPKFDLATRAPATQEILPPRPVADLPASGVAEPLTTGKASRRGCSVGCAPCLAAGAAASRCRRDTAAATSANGGR